VLLVSHGAWGALSQLVRRDIPQEDDEPLASRFDEVHTPTNSGPGKLYSARLVNKLVFLNK
jgi:hypothetical protein